MNEIELFFSNIPNPIHRAKTEEVVIWIGHKYPELKPEFKWNQPMFTHHGTFIIAFSVASNHLAIAPERKGILQFEDEFKQKKKKYSKMLLIYPFDKPFDYDLLAKIIDFNIADKANINSFWRP